MCVGSKSHVFRYWVLLLASGVPCLYFYFIQVAPGRLQESESTLTRDMIIIIMMSRRKRRWSRANSLCRGAH